jgi:lipopolysaccharide export system protein LptA
MGMVKGNVQIVMEKVTINAMTVMVKGKYRAMNVTGNDDLSEDI